MAKHDLPKGDLALSDAEFKTKMDRLRQQQAEREKFEPLIAKAWFDQAQRKIRIVLTNGIELSIPPAFLQEICELSDLELSQIEVGPGGYNIRWDEAGMGAEISNLLAGRFGSRKWMEKLHAELGVPMGLWPDSEPARSAWGKTGARMTSKAKAAASRENGKKGGRPKKQALS